MSGSRASSPVNGESEPWRAGGGVEINSWRWEGAIGGAGGCGRGARGQGAGVQEEGLGLEWGWSGA